MFFPAEQWYSAEPSAFRARSHRAPNCFWASLSLSSSLTGHVCLMMAAAMMSVQDISCSDMVMTLGIACDSKFVVIELLDGVLVAVVE